MLVRLSSWPHHDKTPPPPPPQSCSLQFFPIQCFLTNKVPNRRTTTGFKHAVPRLLDRLARDAMQPARIEGYIKIATMLGDVQCSQCSHSLEALHPHWQYQCSLQQPIGLVFLVLPPFFQPCSTPQLACPLPLTSSSWRSLYMRFQRQSLRRRCPSNRKNSSCVNNLQLLNGNCRPSEEV